MIPHREEIRERLIQDETGFIAELINDETEYKTIKEYNFKTGSKYQDLSTNDKILFHRLIIAELPFIGYDLQQSVKKHRPEIDFRIIEDSVKQTAELNKREIERLELNKEIESRELTPQTPEAYKPKGKKRDKDEMKALLDRIKKSGLPEIEYCKKYFITEGYKSFDSMYNTVNKSKNYSH